MIFYFSGTGNSLYCAQELAKSLGEKAISISDVMHTDLSSQAFSLSENETLGFVFPIYAWAPPKIVLDFIAQIKLAHAASYTFSLSTCGDEEGASTARLRKALSQRKISLDSSFTLAMPNNYIISFDVDSPERESLKLQNAKESLSFISNTLISRKRGVNILIPGHFSSFKTAVINPLFQRYAIRTDKFYATDACTKCGLCVRICPVGTIRLADTPVWGKACTQCLSCINRCPSHAIQFGKGTIKKGRYAHPILRNEKKTSV